MRRILRKVLITWLLRPLFHFFIDSIYCRFCRLVSIYRNPPLQERKLYTYKPLESSSHIRVFELSSTGEPSPDLKCRIHHTTVTDDKYAYIGISYAWGDPTLPKVPIECDSLQALIPPSLHSGLKRLRNAAPDVQYLWADAVSIDQNKENQTEKSLQVRMMDQIFASAQEVIVDLGPIDADQHAILQGLDRYQAIPEDRWSLCIGNSSVAESLKMLQKENVPGFAADFWPGCAKFMQRPWFTRVWIIQEFALAKSVRVMIGEEFRDGKFLEDGLMRAAYHLQWLYIYSRHYPSNSSWLSDLWAPLWDITSILDALRQILILRSRNRDLNKFCNLISVSSVLFKATDPRDKAYALLGMASDHQIKDNFPVDYNESEAALMLRASRYLIRQEFGVFPLYHCVGDKPGFSSWALNLTDTSQDSLSLLIVSTGNTSSPGLYDASGTRGFSTSFSQLRDGGLFVRNCAFLDTVDQAMASSLPTLTGLSVINSPAAQAPWLDEAYDWMQSMDILLTMEGLCGQDFYEQGWRALIADLGALQGKDDQGLSRFSVWTSADRCIKVWAHLHKEALSQKRQVSNQASPPELPGEVLSKDDVSLVHVYGESLRYAFGRRLGLTKKKRLLCLIPSEAKIGDHIVIIRGCCIPFVLREYVDGKGHYFRIVGCVYVHNMMDGQILLGKEWDWSNVEIC
ncbi:hypothetical protein PV10_06731 [Exophiala mesophila]|uniref:Heterokaryon incompatibility domain-containing protein n=1 Tax=Exophiala mesophila TaxID=212818 RepID=A0A0D1XVG9_EXOME|nr:uncharacterized protein PV10_06731 [Exophiala mesophila]KIV92276.1 hypothetical protein PV10_06731 [Exophiala mesophila]